MRKLTFENIANWFLKNFFQGLVIIGPIGLTIFVIWYVVTSIDNIIPSVAKEIPGLVFISTIVFTAILGYLGNKFVVGRFFFDAMDRLLEKTPGVKHIYTPTKDVMSSFVGDKKKFNDPVWVKTNEKPTVKTRLMPLSEAYPIERYFISNINPIIVRASNKPFSMFKIK